MAVLKMCALVAVYCLDTASGVNNNDALVSEFDEMRVREDFDGDGSFP